MRERLPDIHGADTRHFYFLPFGAAKERRLRGDGFLFLDRQCFDGPGEPAREDLGGLATDVTDPECKKQTFERYALRFFDRSQQILRFLFLEERQLHQVTGRECEDVRSIRDDTTLE